MTLIDFVILLLLVNAALGSVLDHLRDKRIKNLQGRISDLENPYK